MAQPRNGFHLIKDDELQVFAGDDYMLIVASWVDGHAEGLRAAAGRFRAAVDVFGTMAEPG